MKTRLHPHHTLEPESPHHLEEAAHHQHYTIDLHIDEHVADAGVNVVLELDLTLSELPEENEGLECLDEEHCGNHELLCRQIL